MLSEKSIPAEGEGTSERKSPEPSTHQGLVSIQKASGTDEAEGSAPGKSDGLSASSPRNGVDGEDDTKLVIPASSHGPVDAEGERLRDIDGPTNGDMGGTCTAPPSTNPPAAEVADAAAVVTQKAGETLSAGKRKRAASDPVDDDEAEYGRKAARSDFERRTEGAKAETSRVMHDEVEVEVAARSAADGEAEEGSKPDQNEGAQNKIIPTAEARKRSNGGKGHGAETGDDEDDGEDEDEDDDDLDVNAMRRHEYEQVARFGPNQLRRYEQYRRSDLKKDKFKRVLTAINPVFGKIASSDPFLIAVKGLTKLFVGDVVEAALDFRKQCGDTGPLQPKHLREAYRRLRREGSVPSTKARPSLF